MSGRILKKIAVASILSILGIFLVYAYNNFYSLKLAKPSPIITNYENFPKPLLKMILTGNMPYRWAIFTKKNNTLYSYVNSTNPNPYNKFLIVRKAIQSSFTGPHRLPDGIYLVSLMDGTHQDYPWPMLTFATDTKVNENSVVLMPDFEALSGYENIFKEVNTAASQYPWNKKEAKIFWRGRATGNDTNVDPNGDFPRKKFVDMTTKSNIVDSGFTGFVPVQAPQYDIEYLKTNYTLKNYVSVKDSLKYKYLIDIDGNSCSYERMAWILYSNSLLFKHKSDRIQWYYRNLTPLKHYVPIASDFSDLEEKFSWIENNPEIAKQISKNAREFSKKTFNRKSLLQATRTAFLNYHKLTEELSSKPIKHPRPLKVFQIGFNKCGTTTLSDFFNDNGIKSIHYGDGKIAVSMWNNHLHNKPLISKEYDQYLGYFDMQNIHTDPPIFIAQSLYKEFDKQYPGSKFILNTRDRDAWIKSRSNHQTKYGISYLELNARIYKISTAEVIKKWADEWDAHMAEVKEYFKDRPQDLLVFNIETEGPEKLQQFFKDNFVLDPFFYGHKNKTRKT